MGKDLTTIVAVSNDLYVYWQVFLMLQSLKDNNFKYETHILVYNPKDREWNLPWEKFNSDKVRVFKYDDNTKDVSHLLRDYHTIHRNFSLREHFKMFPYLSNNAILYLDSDVILTKELDLDEFKDNDINYGSDIRSYNNLDYFDGKISRVSPNRIKQYKEQDPLNSIWRTFGVNREILRENNDKTAGVHYLLKNIDYQFWDTILKQSVPLIHQINYLNNFYIEGKSSRDRQNNGWQSFCADIWITLWQLWGRGSRTEILPQLDFTWSTDLKEKVSQTWWIHNAGVTQDLLFDGQGPSFFKGIYATNTKTPFDDSEIPYIKSIITNEKSSRYANSVYASYIDELRDTYNIKFTHKTKITEHAY